MLLSSEPAWAFPPLVAIPHNAVLTQQLGPGRYTQEFADLAASASFPPPPVDDAVTANRTAVVITIASIPRDGNVSVSVAANVFTDYATNGNRPSNTVWFVIDRVAPSTAVRDLVIQG